MHSPLISVLIPCFNAEHYIIEAIQSVQNQSYKRLEIILIEDGSSDNTKAIIQDIQETDQRIRILFNESNLGLIKSLNKGAQQANGQFIIRMDADDISMPERVQKQFNAFTQNPSFDIIGTKALPIDTQGKKLKDNSLTYSESDTLRLSVLFTQPFFHGSVMIRSKILKENPYLEEYKHSEDFELWNRLVSKGFKLANLKEPLYLYRINPESVSRKFESMQIESHNLASQHYLQLLLGKKITSDIVGVLNNRPKNNTSFNIVKESLNYFDVIVSKVIKDLNSEELLTYCSRQKIDILVQCFVNCNSITTKIYCITNILSSLHNTKSRTYLMKKISKTFNS